MASTSKRSRKAPVWTYMEKTGPDITVCLICKDSLKYCGNTSNMTKHIRTRHPIEFAQMQEDTTPVAASHMSDPESERLPGTSTATLQPTLMQTIDRTQSYRNDSIKKNQLDLLLVKMVAKDLQPLSITEDKGFKDFVQGLNPRYKLPSRRELTRTLLPNMYEQEVARISKELENVEDIALTTDIWTSRQTQGFITVTAHFISSDYNVKSAVLETARMTKNHTAENIAEDLTSICNKWNILSKICCVITDNAANMTSAIKSHMKLRNIPCFAHTLNLVVQDSLKNTKDLQIVKDKVKQIVTFFHHSVKATDKLSQLQVQHNVPVKKLIQDVETRWNSTYHMLERFVQQSNLVTTTLCLLGKNHLCISNDELSLIKKVIPLLEYFDEATKELSAEKFTSLSKVIPIVRGLQDSLQMIDDDMDGLTLRNIPLSEELKKQMSRRFATVEGIFLVGAATILDPRFKKLPFADASNIKAIEERLKNILRSKYTNYASESSTAPSVPSLPGPESTIKSGKKSLWNSFDAKAEKTSQIVSNPSAEAIMELRRYFEEPRVMRSEDPLSWWKKKAPLFPNLSKIAKGILCVPATSVPSERLFSKAGELISQRRSTLKEKNVNMILFLNKNLK